MQRQIDNTVPERDIVWQFKGGRTTKQAADYLLDNVETYVHKYGKTLLTVWTGTRDLTKKVNRFIDLSSITVDEIIGQCQKIFDLKHIYGVRVQVLVLECPYYSTSIWNSNRGHKNINIFEENNRLLHDRITELNNLIRELNQANGVSVPRFSLDLIKSRKSNKSLPAKTVAYSLLLDGIHPGITLSKYWNRRLVFAVIFKYCYR